jgi:hypothetical protein
MDSSRERYGEQGNDLSVSRRWEGRMGWGGGGGGVDLMGRSDGDGVVAMECTVCE